MVADLDAARSMLLDGIRRAKQGSYQRQAPAKAAMPSLLRARENLYSISRTEGNNPDLWRLVAMAEEYLLNYPGALAALQKGVDLAGKPSKKDLKKLAQLRQVCAQRAPLPFTRSELKRLGEYLEEHLPKSHIERSFKWTLAWLEREGRADDAKVVEILRARGIHCDDNVLYNLVPE